MPTGFGDPVCARGGWNIVQAWVRFGEGAPGTVLGVGVWVVGVGEVVGGVSVLLRVSDGGAVAGYGVPTFFWRVKAGAVTINFVRVEKRGRLPSVWSFSGGGRAADSAVDGRVGRGGTGEEVREEEGRGGRPF